MPLRQWRRRTPINPYVRAVTDAWNSADPYERFIGRWSRLVAGDFIRWLDAPSGAIWVDVGCGTGALSEVIGRTASPERVVGIDPSNAYIEQAAASLDEPIFSFKEGDALELPENDSTYEVAVSALMLNFLSDPAGGVEEMRRVTKPGGIVGSYVWDYAGEMQMLRYFWDAAVELDPSARELDEGVRFAVARRPRLASLWRDAGLSEVETTAIDIPTRFANFDDYWEPFFGGQGPAPGYNVSLSADEQRDLRDLLAARLPIAADGSIELIARAWAVKGRVQD